MINYTIIEKFFLNFIMFTLPLAIIAGNAVVNFYLILVCIFYFNQCFLQKKLINSKKIEFKILLVFYFYLIFNSILSQDILISLFRSIFYVKFLIFLIFSKYLFEKNYFNINYLGFFWLIIITLLSLDIFYQNFFGENIFGYKSVVPARNSGFFFDELIAGGFITAFSFLSLMLVNKKINLKIQFIFIIFFLIAVFYSGERSSFIKYMIIFFGMVSFYLSNFSKRYKTISILIILVLSTLIFNSQTFKGRYLDTISFSPEKKLSFHDTYFRSQYGAHTLSAYYILKNNFWFGVGNKNFRSECINYESDVLKFQKKIEPNGRVYLKGCSTHPHQIYNEFLSEHGVLGTIIIISLMAYLIIKYRYQVTNSKVRFVALLYIIGVFLPIIPSGSFFTTTTSMLIWTNFLFFTTNLKKTTDDN